MALLHGVETYFAESRPTLGNVLAGLHTVALFTRELKSVLIKLNYLGLSIYAAPVGEASVDGWNISRCSFEVSNTTT
jgi:hypothetical protein